MRVGFVTTSLSSEDGWGRYSKSIAESVARFAEVRVITRHDAPNDTTLKQVYAELPKISFHPLAQFKVFMSCMRHLRGCDVIHVMTEPYAPAAALASIFLRARFIMTLHGTYSVAPQGFGFQRLAITFALKRAHLSTTGSYKTEEKARERVKFGECRFISNGVDPDLFRVLPDRKAGDYIMTTGGVKPRKGADITTQALIILKDEFPWLRYKVVGDMSNTTFVEKVRSIAKEGGVADRVELLGFVSVPELVRLYNDAQAFVLAARVAEDRFEGFPMVYFEAYGCGAPIITTRGFGSEYAIRDNETGYLIPMEDPKALADAIRKIVGDSSNRQKLSEEALRWAKKHTWDSLVEEHVMKMYEDAMKK